MSIIFSGEKDDSYCNKDGTKLIERVDGTALCPSCEKLYNLETDTTMHLSTVVPEINPYSKEGPEIVRMDQYAEYKGKKKKKEEVTAYEDVYWAARKSGLYITDSEEFLP
jgi:uncharacterized Zn finger protein (UPF0148 family)